MYIEADFSKRIISISEFKGSVVTDRMKFPTKEAMEKFLRSYLKENRRRKR